MANDPIISATTPTPSLPATPPRFILISKLFRGLGRLGPGIVTGASDDDPSGIATYSQIGAQFGFAMLWTMLLTYPLMDGIQEISAWIGRVTGVGIAGNIRAFGEQASGWKNVLKDSSRRKSNWLISAAKRMAKAMDSEWRDYKKS